MASQQQQAGKARQTTLAGWFGKSEPASQSASSSAAARRPSAAAAAASSSTSSMPTPPETARKASASKGKQLHSSAAPASSSPAATKAAGLSAGSKTKTPLAQRAQVATPPVSSEADVDFDNDDSVSVKPQSSSVPAKRAVAFGDDDDEADSPGRKRRAAQRKPVILDTSSDESDDDEPVRKPAGKLKRGKGKVRDEDDFIADSGNESPESEDYFDDDLDDIIASGALDDEPEPPKKPSPKKKQPSKAAASRPPPKPSTSKGGSASGSGSLPTLKTKAALAREDKRSANKDGESPFAFLVNSKDLDGIPHSEEGSDPRTLYIPKSAWAALTPFERQFWEIKQKHFDTVLFFQKGKFYELYENDAHLGHREFDLKLTDRVKMSMVGVPESHFDFWAAKFLAKGYRVGRVAQSENKIGAEIRMKDGKSAGASKTKSKGKAAGGDEDKIVQRELKTVLTTGTLVDAELLSDDQASHCVAIKEYTPSTSSSPVFGVCAVDAATAEFSLSSFEDDISRTGVETLMRQLKPKELLHEKGNLSAATVRLLRNTLSLDCQWTALKPEKEFLTADAARVEIRHMFAAHDGGGAMDVDGDESAGATLPEAIRQVYDKPVAMSALGGMIWYLRQLNLDNELATARNFNIYDPISRGRALNLDGQSLAHMEVLQNSHGGTEGTLLQLFSRCVTPFGKRLFKIWLCSPLRDAADINARLDAVEDLIATPAFEERFDKTMRGVPDLERLISRVHAKTCKKADFLKVMASFERVGKALAYLKELASDFTSASMRQLLEGAPDTTEMRDAIQELYDGDEMLPVEGKDDEFEVVRGNVEQVEAKLQAALSKYKKELGSRDLTFKDIGTKDIFMVQVPVKVKTPSNWIKMSGTKDFNRYYTPEIEKLVKEIKEARERKSAYLNDFCFKVYAAFDEHYSTWMQVVKTVAEVDCLLNLAKTSVNLGEPAVRPEIVEGDAAFVDFEDLRHPCMLLGDFIPSDVRLGRDARSMMLLTGANMAGKSTVSRMTCVAVIMAQLGCFVPAAKARLSPVDAIYSRMGANDHIFANASTFKVEMDDCNKILTKATPRSLVILDELGRGTSTYDGMAIAYAVLHRLATHVGPIGIFATHYTSLTADFAYHPQIRLCHMAFEVDEETRNVVFLYRLVDGASSRSYGPNVAKMAGLPEAIVSRAMDISKQFEETTKARELQKRANEALPLAIQADAAFLLRFAQDGVDADMDQIQLAKTLRIIRKGIQALST